MKALAEFLRRLLFVSLLGFVCTLPKRVYFVLVLAPLAVLVVVIGGVFGTNRAIRDLSWKWWRQEW